MAKGFSKKRIDHRHHALDALVIACITKDHINYLNSINSERTNYSLVSKLRRIEEEIINGEKKKIAKEFHKPWEGFTKKAEDELNQTIISFKQNTRVINKTVNKYQVWKEEDGAMKKITTKQTKGDNWAIRKPMHAETVSGKVFLKRIKQSHITIANAIEQVELIVDAAVKKQLSAKIKQYPNNNIGLKKHLKAYPIMINRKAIDKVQIYETIEATATRKTLDITFDEKRIEKITDTGIQKILLNHLKQENYQNSIDENGKIIPAHEIAFSENGLDELNKNIIALNNGKKHQPIKKVRVFEESNKFPLGETGNKTTKFVDTAKGTNLYFAIYKDDLNNKKFITVSLYIVIQNLKDGLPPVPDKHLDDKTKVEYKLTQFLSPNDLVYIPTNDELENSNNIDLNNFSKDQVHRLYNVNDFSGYTIYFTPNQFAKNIAPKELDTSFDSKLSKSLEGITIKENFWKLEVDRLGKITRIIQ